jgi:hypothetical protein
VNFFAATENQVFPQLHGATPDGQGAPVDQFGAGLRQGPSSKVGKRSIQFLGQHQLQNGVAQKFQPLIVFGAGIFSCAMDGCVNARRSSFKSRNS